ncbi:MAG: glycosyltransferase [Solirubrobacteraceae bacterium]
MPEKGIEAAIAACARAGVTLVIAGEGPERGRLESGAAGARFVGRASGEQLAQLRDQASVALAPSLFAETFGLAAAEAMAAGLPVAASRIGALPELVPDDWLVAPGDVHALARVVARLADDPGASALALARARAVTAPEVVGRALTALYDRAVASRGNTRWVASRAGTPPGC